MNDKTLASQDPKRFANFVLSQILPTTGLITHQGDQWRLNASIEAPVANQTFRSREEVVEKLVDYYADRYGDESGMKRAAI